MTNKKFPLAGALFIGLFSLYVMTFRVSLAAVGLATFYFILMVMLGQATRLFRFPGEDGLFRIWLVPVLTGMGLFRLIWFAAKVVHLPHLVLIVPLALASTAAALKFGERRVPETGGRKQGSVWVVVALLVCTSVTYFPFKNFGLERDGFFHYRASFWAVSTKHLAVVNTLCREYPFANPYFHGETFHYYYLSYALPAALKESGLTTEESVFAYQAVQAYVFVLLCFYFFGMLTENKRRALWLT